MTLKHKVRLNKTGKTAQIIVTPRKWWVWWVFIRVFTKRTFQRMFGGRK